MLSRLALRTLDDNDSPQAQDALVREMLAGSRRAWAAFHARYDRLILGCINKVTLRFSAFFGEDDVVEIYATLLAGLCAHDMSRLRSFDAYRGNRLSTWLGILAVNFTYDRLRMLRRRPDSASLDECEDMDSDEPTPHEALERKEQIAMVGEILRGFGEKDREFVTLYFDEGLDAEQVAARMRISVSTVYSKKHKIQSRIEARLSETTRLAA
jgi:RNA polymerase sigma-70 factor (ECF subfamily)